MKASAKKAKASDPAEDFIIDQKFQWQMRDRTKMWWADELRRAKSICRRTM